MPERAGQRTSHRLVAALVVLACVPLAVGAWVLAGGFGDEGASSDLGAADSPPQPRPARPSKAVEGRFFARRSFWNAPLPDDAAVDPESDRLVQALVADVERQKREETGPWIQTHEYSTPLYTVGRRQRPVPVRLDTGPWGRTLGAAFAAGVPIPDGAKPAPGTDGHLTIYQPSTDRLWEFWRAVKRPDGWHASWGGAMRNVSASPGYYTKEAWRGAGPNWGSTATSLPVIGGTILIDEIARRQIPHALAMSPPDARRGVFAWPAQRSDGRGGPSALPEGARLRIDPDVDVGRLDMHPVGEAIARAAQRHGLVVRDITHHATALYAEDPGPRGQNPYARLFDGRLPNEVLAGFPWDRLQVLRMNLCTQAPCPRGDSP